MSEHDDGYEDPYRYGQSMQGGTDRLNSIIFAVASGTISLLIGIGLYQMDRIIKKMDAFSDGMGHISERLTRVETRLEDKPK